MDLIMHIGLPKTATTFLQNELFCLAKGYLGKSKSGVGLMKNKKIKTISSLATQHQFMKTSDVTSATKRWVSELCQFKFDKNDLGAEKLILSSEDFFNWFPVEDRFKKWPIGSPLGLSEKRSEIFPFADYLGEYLVPEWTSGNIEVLVVLRNQSEWLASAYAQRSRYIISAGQHDFEQQVEKLISSQDPSINWSLLVGDLDAVLGKENVHVMFYEDIGNEWFYSSLCERLSITSESLRFFEESNPKSHTNVKRTEVSNEWIIEPCKAAISPTYISRYWPSWLPGDAVISKVAKRLFDPLLLRILVPDRGASIELTASLKDKIKSHCGESNSALSERVGRDLTTLGY